MREQTLGQHPVELADMPERERPQERPKRRRRRHRMPEHRPRLSRAQHVAVIDAISPEHHRRDQRHDLAARVRRPAPAAEIDRLIDQSLDPQPLSKHRGQQHPSIRDRPPVIEDHPRRVRQTLHHAGDLLLQARRRPTRQLSACSGGHLNLSLGRLPIEQRWIQAHMDGALSRGSGRFLRDVRGVRGHGGVGGSRGGTS